MSKQNRVFPDRREDLKTTALREAAAYFQQLYNVWGSPDIKEKLDLCNAALAGITPPPPSDPSKSLTR